MREPIPKETREVVLLRDGALCRYCLRFTQTIHLDHIFPASQGGSNDLRNLVVSCPTCNLSKHAKIPSRGEDLPHIHVPCGDCGLRVSLWGQVDGWWVDFRGLFGWCDKCWEIRCELWSWDELQFAEDFGLEPLAA